MHVGPPNLPPARSIVTPVADTIPAAEGGKPVPAAEGGKPAPQVIGKVLQVQGDAWIIHEGQKTVAQANAPLLLGDSVETAQGSEISLVFADRSTLALKDKGLVGLDDFTYDPATKTGHETLLVAQGGFSFVSGDIAKTRPDAAHLATPVMSMGIRGTAIAGQVAADGNTSVALLPDPGSNFVGEVTIGRLGGGGESFTLNSAGAGIIGATSSSSWSVSPTAAASVATFAPAPVAPAPTPPTLPGPTGAGAAAPAAAGAAQAAAEPAAAATSEPVTVAPPPAPATNTAEPGNTLAGLVSNGTGAGTPPGGSTGIGSTGTGSTGSTLFNGPATGATTIPVIPQTSTTTTTTIPVTASVTGGSGFQGHSVTGTVSGTDANADVMSYHIRAGDGTLSTSLAGTLGTLSIDPTTGVFSYTPSGTSTGTDSFTVRVDNGHGGYVDQTVVIDLAANPITTVNAGATGSSGSTLSGLVSASDPAGDSMTYTLVGANGGAANGTVTINPDGTYTYVPGSPLPLTDSFTVSISNGHDPAITLTVNVAETAIPVTASVTGGSGFQGHAVTGSVSGTDANADTMSYHLRAGDGTLYTTLAGTLGTLTIDPVTGAFSYAPSGTSTGTDTFTVRVDNGHGGYVDQTVVIDLAANPITTVNAGATGVTGATLAGLVSASDPAGDSMTYTLVGANGGATNGTVTINADGTYSYVPSSAVPLTDSFTVSISNGYDPAVSVTVTISEVDLLMQSGSTLHVMAAATVIDSDFSTIAPASATTLTFDVAAGHQGVILDSYSHTAGIVNVDASATTDGVLVDGSARSDTLSILGGSGADTLIGGSGNAILNGGAGNDTIFGGVGSDTLTGGGGSDVFVFTDPTQSHDGWDSRDTITDFVSGTDHIKLTLSGSHVDVSGFASVSSYNGGQATLSNDGTVGDGFYAAGADRSLYIYVGGTTTDIASDGGYVISSPNPIAAADLDFVIAGNGTNNTLVGGAGNDTIYAGPGSDTLTGGGGADTFVLPASVGTATITDFQHNIDSIELDNSDFGLGTSGTLAAANFATATSSQQMDSSTPTNYSGGTSATAGIVVINDNPSGPGATVWYTTDLHAATTLNSHEIAHVTNVDTSALDNTQFHLHV